MIYPILFCSFHSDVVSFEPREFQNKSRLGMQDAAFDNLPEFLVCTDPL